MHEGLSLLDNEDIKRQLGVRGTNRNSLGYEVIIARETHMRGMYLGSEYMRISLCVRIKISHGS